VQIESDILLYSHLSKFSKVSSCQQILLQTIITDKEVLNQHAGSQIHR